MANWLLVAPIHSTEIHHTYIGRPWPYQVIPNKKLRSGDLVYLVAGQSGLYGWGYVGKIEGDLNAERITVSVSRPVVQEGLVPLAEMEQHSSLAGIMTRLNGNFVELTPKQSNALNSLAKLRTTDVPPDVPEIQDNIGKFGVRDATSFQPKLGLAVEQYSLASALFLDLDNFKSVNDRYDHATGDQVIREALAVIESVIQTHGELFHRSGDEMVVLLPNLNDGVAREIAEKIRSAIEAKVFSVIGQGVVTTTIGLATYPDSCENWQDLETVADRTAMQAKKKRKNAVLSRLEVINEEKKLKEYNDQEKDLINAIEAKQSRAKNNHKITTDFLLMVLEAFNDLKPIFERAGDVFILDDSAKEFAVSLLIKNKEDMATGSSHNPDTYNFSYRVEARVERTDWRPTVLTRNRGKVKMYRLHDDDQSSWYHIAQMTKEIIKSSVTRSYKNPGRW